MVKRGFCPSFLINREARIKGALIFSVLILTIIVIFSYLVFVSAGGTGATCNGQVCAVDEKCLFDAKQTAVCVVSSVCGACPSDKSCTIAEDGSVKCGLTLPFCSDKKCDAGKICAIDLREMLKCRNLNLCNGVSCTSGQKCVKDIQGIASCQSAKSCSELSCPMGQMCKEEVLGVGKCVQSKKIIDAGVEKEYAYESCLLEKPKFLDNKGEVQENYCYGKDKISGTSDDCGCPKGMNCNANTGKCDKFCSDGTLSERCSRNQPRYCDSSGNLINFASGSTKDSEHLNGCGCPSGKRENVDNGCSGESSFDFMTSEEFGGKEAVFSNVNLTRQSSIVFGYPGDSYINTAVSNCKGGYYWINHPELHFWGYDSSWMMYLFNRKIAASFDSAGYKFWGACYNTQDVNFPKITCPADKKILRDYESYCFIPDSQKNPSFEIDVDKNVKFNSIDVYFGYPYIVDYRIEYLPAGMNSKLEQNWKVLNEGSNGNLFKEDSPDYFDGDYYSENDLQYRIKKARYADSAFVQKTDDDAGVKKLVKNGKVVLEKGIWNGYTYGYFIREIKLNNYISADKIRLVPLTWQPNAALYRISVYDKSTKLKLDNGPLILTANGLTYSSGQFQSGGEYESKPSFLDVPSRILEYSTFNWNSDVEKRAPVIAFTNSGKHGTKVDAFITGLDRNYPNVIKVDVNNGPWLDCSDCDQSYRYFGVDYTNNIYSPNGTDWNLRIGEEKRYASNTDVPNVGSTKLYYDPNCVNAGGVENAITSLIGPTIIHNSDGSFKDISKLNIAEGNKYCTTFPVSLATSSLGTADSAGQNHGILGNGISLDTSSYVGKSGSSARFLENTNNYIKVNSFEDLDIGTGDFTFSFWFKLDPSKKDVLINGEPFYNYRILFRKQPETGNYLLLNPNLGYTIWTYDQINNGVRDLVFEFQLGKGGAQRGAPDYNPFYLPADTNAKKALDPSFDPYDGKWHQVIFRLDRKKYNGVTYATSYIDGAEASSPEGVFWTGALANFVPDNLDVKNDGPFFMGTGRASDNWVGGIDEVAIYHRVLNRDEINTLYNAQKNGRDILQESQDLKSNLAAYWKFDGASSSIALREKDESFKTEFLVLPKDINANRLVIEELKNNIQRIKLKAEYGDGSVEYLADYKKVADHSNKNVESVIDFDIPANKKKHCSSKLSIEKNCFLVFKVELYSKDSVDKRMKIWNIGMYNRPDSNADSARDSGLRFLFKSAKTKEELVSAPWYGHDGVLIDIDPARIVGEIAAKGFSTSGQQIGEVHKGNQWFQWKAIFLPSSSKLSSPVLNKVNINYFGGRDKAPDAAIRFDSDDIAVGREVIFDGSVSEGGGSGITNYQWEFSGGTTIEGLNSIVKHTFNNPGVNFVSLTVTTEGGLTSKFIQYFIVAPYDCFSTSEDAATPNADLFEVSEEDKALLKNDVLQKFSDASGVPINSIDTPEEYMAAALYYTYTQITYRSDSETIQCVGNAGINVNNYRYYNGFTSLPLSKKQVDDLKKNPAFTSGSCACATPYCGDCKRFSIFYASILRAMGVNSKCIYIGVTDNHATNIVNYHGKYRIIEPQVLSTDYAFNSKILEDWLGDSGAQKVSTLFVRGVVNDKVGSVDCSFGDSRCSIIASTRQNVYYQTAGDAERYVRNPVGLNGLPDSSIGAKCIKTLDRSIYGNYSLTAQSFGMDSKSWAWDPATLFEDVCP